MLHGGVTEFTDGVRNRLLAMSLATDTSIGPRDGDPHPNFRFAYSFRYRMSSPPIVPASFGGATYCISRPRLFEESPLYEVRACILTGNSEDILPPEAKSYDLVRGDQSNRIQAKREL